jgi:hypothetical protein
MDHDRKDGRKKYFFQKFSIYHSMIDLCTLNISAKHIKFYDISDSHPLLVLLLSLSSTPEMVWMHVSFRGCIYER